MTVTVRSIIPAKQAENVQTTQYTAASATTIVDKMTATNTSAGNVLFSVNLVAVGGSASASNLIIDERAIAPNETYVCTEMAGHVLESGGFISTLADTASALTISASGREIT